MLSMTRMWCFFFGLSMAASGVLASVQSPQVPIFASATDVIPNDLRSATDRVGSLNGEFRVSESGAATYSISIYAPQGTAGVTPQVSLNYSSLSGNGIAGKGWSLGGGGGISRCRQTEHQDKKTLPITFSDTDRFCLDGQRLLVVSGAYGAPGSVYKTEIDSFVTVVSVGGTSGHPDYWTVERKDGSISRYGKSGNDNSESKVLNLDGTVSSMVMVWALDNFQDSVGNEVNYAYSDDAEGHRIESINYAYGSNSTAGASVEFDYEDRVIDPSEGYVAGYKRRNTQRLKRITSKNGSSIAKIYKLRYMDSSGEYLDPSKLSKLVGIKKCVAENSCMPETIFEWTQPQEGFSVEPSFQEVLENQSDRFLGGYRYADIDGDGVLDFIWQRVDYDGADLDYMIWSYMSSSHGENSAIKTALYINEKNNVPYNWDMVDYNADGRSDLLVFHGKHGQWVVYLSVYNPITNSWEIDYESNSIILTGISESDVHFSDINSDGLVDASVAVSGGAFGEGDVVKRYVLGVDGDASISDRSYYKFYELDEFPAGTSLTMHDDFSQLGGGDFDGDGKVDSVFKKNQVAFTSPECIYDHTQNCRLDLKLASHFFLSDGSVFHSNELAGISYGMWFDQEKDSLPGQYLAVRLADLNLDGYTDAVVAVAGEHGRIGWAYMLSDGKKFLPMNYFYNHDILGSHGRTIRNMQPILSDINADGYVDFVWHDVDANKIKVKNWSKAHVGFESEVREIFSTQGAEGDGFSIFDVNGDGVNDVVYYDGKGNWRHLSFYHGNYGGNPVNLVSRIFSSSGAATDITYKSLSAGGHYQRMSIGGQQDFSFCSSVDDYHCRDISYIQADEAEFYSALNGGWELPDGSKTLGKIAPVLELSTPSPVVAKVASSAPLPGDVSAKSSISYYYGGGKVQASGRGSLGFQRLKTIDEQTGVSTVTTYRQDWPFIGYPLDTKVYSEQGNLLKESHNTWDVRSISNWAGSADAALQQGTKYLGSLQPYISKSFEKIYELADDGGEQGSILKTITTETTKDADGNPTQIKITMNGGGKKYRTVTTNTYSPPGLPSSYAKNKGRLSKTVVKNLRDDDGDGSYEKTSQRASSFTYYTSGEEYGMLLSEKIEPGTPFERTTHYSYDKFGNKVRSKVVAMEPSGLGGKVTRCDVDTVKFDSTGRYVDVTRDCAGRKITEVTLRDKFGSPKRVRNYIDASGSSYVEAQYAYTAGGVNYFQTDDSGSFEATTLELCTNGCGLNAAFYIRHWGPGNSATPARVELAREYVDVLGRPIKKLTRGFDGTWVHQDIEYDSLGRVQRKSVPYYQGSEPEGWTTLTYDILGRVVNTVHPDGSSQSTDYNGFVTTYTNAKGQVKKETHNALGELVSVEDNLGTKVYYGYDAQGNLATTRHDNGTSGQSDDTIIAMEYDLLGRKTSMNDPDKGVWTYQYNAFGELETQTNAKGQTSTLLYDGLGRRVSREDRLMGGQLAGQTTWAYDGPNGLGQLAHVADSISGYVKVVEYDNLGRPSKTVTSLGVDGEFGNHYEKVTYDQYGRAYQVFDAARNDDSYTDNGIEYRYNQYGYQHQVVDAVYNNGATRKVYHTVTGMDALGNVTGETLGSGVAVRQKEYDSQTGRLKIVRASNASKTVQELEYEWDAIGNLDSVHDTGTGGANNPRNRLTSYSYDSLNRLTSTQWKKNGSVIGTDGTTYYRNGNIKTKTGVGTYVYDRSCGCGPHAVTQAGNTTYRYDANGNMVRDSSGRKIAYTTFDKAYRMERGSTQVSFAYDTSRKRYLRTDTDSAGTQTTLYIGSVEKITHKDGSKQWKRYIGGNLMILQDVSGAGAITQSHTRYLLTDHLGSLQYILDAGGFVIQSLGFDPWGDRLNAFQNEGSKPWSTDLYNILETTRGFTGHEMVDGLDIVHMNGRIYDSRLGRFLQADPRVDGVTNTQGYNRYSYVHNNPLNATDPSGYNAFKEFFDDITGISESPILNGVVQTAGCIVTQGACPAFLAAYNSTFTYGMTGDIGAAIQSGVIAGVSAAAFASIGEYFTNAGGMNEHLVLDGLLDPATLHEFGGNWLTSGQIAGQISAHAITGGVTASLQGSKFGHGFVSAGLTKGVMAGSGFNYANRDSNAVVGRTVVAFIVGGTTSKITGGKFANGAITASIAHLLNQEYSASESSKMTKNKDGNWQYRENAAFEAAGLNPSTETHSCSGPGVSFCAFVATFAGEGDTKFSSALSTTNEVTNTAAEMINVSLPIWVKMSQYFSTFAPRFEQNVKTCEELCEKQSFERN